MLRRGAALAAVGDGSGSLRLSRSRKRRRGRGGSKGKGKRSSRSKISSRSRSAKAGTKASVAKTGSASDHVDETPSKLDVAAALHRAHKGGRALTSEESTELAAALAAAVVRNQPLPPVLRPPYTPIRATDPADCSPKALLAGCPGELLRQIIEEEGAAWCQRSIGSIMTTTAQGGELPRPRNHTQRRGSELESVIRAAAEGVNLAESAVETETGTGASMGVGPGSENSTRVSMATDPLAISAAIRTPADASAVLAAQFQFRSRVTRMQRRGGGGGAFGSRAASPMLSREQRQAADARETADRAAQERERSDATGILGARRVDVHFHQRRADRALVQSGIALFSPLHAGQALYSAAMLLATQCTHVPIAPDASSSPHAVTAVTD